MLAFLLALIGGFAVPYLDAPLAQPLARLMEKHIRLEPGEVRVISLLIVLLVVAILAWILSSGTPFWIAVGMILGYFALRLVTLARELIDARQG
jgi:hypothetical protein